MYLLITYPYFAPPFFPLPAGNHWFSISVESVSVLLLTINRQMDKEDVVMLCVCMYVCMCERERDGILLSHKK